MEVTILVGFIAVVALCMCMWLAIKVGGLNATLEEVSKKARAGTVTTAPVDVAEVARTTMPGLIKWLEAWCKEAARGEIGAAVQRALDEKIGGLGNSAAISDKVAQLLVNELSQYSCGPFANRLMDELKLALAEKIATAEWLAQLQTQTAFGQNLEEAVRGRLSEMAWQELSAMDIHAQLVAVVPGLLAEFLASPDKKETVVEQFRAIMSENLYAYVNDAINEGYNEIRETLKQQVSTLLAEELARPDSDVRSRFLDAAMTALGWNRY
jgi:hypothetical protein